MSARRLLAGLLVLAFLGTTGCALLPGGKSERRPASVYLLDIVPATERATREGCPVVVVNTPEPAPGFTGAGMLYRRAPNKLERFAYSRWAETPSGMLAPSLIGALRASGAYSAVLPSPAAVPVDARIESDGLRVLQVFDGDASRVDVTLDVRVYAPSQRRLLGVREFRYSEPAAGASADAGVAAAERAVRALLSDFADFVVSATADLGTADCR